MSFDVANQIDLFESARRKQSDQKSFVQLCLYESSHLYDFCVVMTGDQKSCEDVVYDKDFYIHMANFSSYKTFRVDLYRKVRKMLAEIWFFDVSTLENTKINEILGDPNLNIQIKEKAKAYKELNRFLMNLSPVQRETLFLRKKLDFDLEEISQITERSEEEVRTSLSAARTSLIDQLPYFEKDPTDALSDLPLFQRETTKLDLGTDLQELIKGLKAFRDQKLRATIKKVLYTIIAFFVGYYGYTYKKDIMSFLRTLPSLW